MQYISLTMRKMKLLALFLAMVVMSNMGFCQNTPQKDMKVDTVKQTTPTAVSSHKTVGASTSVEVTNPTTITYNDTALKSIQDTLNLIAENARWKFLWAESTKSNSWVGFAAMIVGILAAIFAGLGFKYQRRASKTLNRMEPKRLPYVFFANKIYENIMSLDILREIEVMPMAEKKKEERRSAYKIREVLSDMHLPEDMIDLSCYENNPDVNVYFSAINNIVEWRRYNSSIDAVIQQYDKSGVVKINSYDKLKRMSISLFDKLSEFEDEIIGKDKKSRFSKNSFIRDKFIDLFNLTEKSIDCALYDPKYAIYDIQKLNWELDFPIKVEKIIDKKMTIGERFRLLLRNPFKKNNHGWAYIVPQMVDLRMKEWPDKVRNFIVDLTLGCGGSIYESNVFHETPLKKLFPKLCEAIYKDDKFNNTIGIWLVYSCNLMEQRMKMLNDDKDAFFAERDWFTKERERYAGFCDLFIREEGYCWTIKGFLEALVAEQSLRIFEDNYDVTYTGVERTDWYNSKDDRPFALEILPFLKKIGIVDTKGNISIKTISELEKALSGIPEKILDDYDWDELNKAIKDYDIYTVHDESVLKINNEVHYYDKED